MTRRGSVLPTPDDRRRFVVEIQELGYKDRPYGWSVTVKDESPLGSLWFRPCMTFMEAVEVATRDLNLIVRGKGPVTARSLAPFPLAEKDW